MKSTDFGLLDILFCEPIVKHNMITVTVKTEFNNIPCIPKTMEYTGEVISNPKWIGEDSLCMTTGLDWFPMRVIKKSSIVSSSVPVAYTEPVTDKNVFEVQGSNGNKYIITRNKHNWSCTCVGFGFRNTCKHVIAAKKFLTKQNKSV